MAKDRFSIFKPENFTKLEKVKSKSQIDIEQHLIKKHFNSMTEWEKNFIMSISKSSYCYTIKQKESIKNIFKKYENF